MANGIYILGAGVMQIPAIKAGKRLGLKVTVVDGSSQAPGIPLADNFLPVDLKDKEGILEHARKDKNIAGIITAGTDFSASVAYVAEKLGLPGISYETALKASHKGKMRQCFAQKGIPSPDFVVYQQGDNIHELSDKIGFPCVIKPVDNMGARGVKKIYNSQELSQDLEDSLTFSRAGQVIIEEFMEGPEFSLDAIIYQGSIEICGIADRHITFDPYFIEMGHTMPSSLSQKDLSAIEKAFIQGIQALGIHTGAAKGDIKLTPKGPMIGEIAARLSGGYMSGWTYPYSSGIDLVEAAIKIAIGLEPGDLRPTRQLVSAERAFISIPGVVREIRKAELQNTDASVKEIFYRIEEGDIVNFPHNNVEKCGNIISQARDFKEASESCRELINSIVIFLELKNKTTEDFLYHWEQKDFPPSCLPLTHDLNISYLNRLMHDVKKRISSSDNQGIIPFPQINDERSTDWYGNSLSEILDLTEKEMPIQWNPQGNAALSLAFCLSLIRGGFQGALYTLENYTNQGDEFLKRIHFI